LTTVIFAASSVLEALPSASMLTARHVPTSVAASAGATVAGSAASGRSMSDTIATPTNTRERSMA